MRSLIFSFVLVTACAQVPPPVTAVTSGPNALTDAERAAGWRPLFDGRTLNGWHGLGLSGIPAGLWTVQDGALVHLEKRPGVLQADGQPLEGFDLVSDSTYENFELSWEWNISRAGNSGLKYNVSEQLSTTFAPPHAAKGWEYQMIDDAENEDNKLATHRSGALYDMFAPDDRKKRVFPAGEWNQSRLVFRGTHGEHWLNGEKVVDFDIATSGFVAAFAKSKYAQYPEWFPVRRKGRIVLQDHDSVVRFRAIKIRVEN